MTAGQPGKFVSRHQTRTHVLEIGGQQFQITAPFDPDALLDDPVTEQRYKADNYLPYWPIIWPSGLMLAEKILRDGTTPPGVPAGGGGRVIELGCGLGITGIAAAKRGWAVTFTDYDPEAVEFAGHNALRNGVPPERVTVRHMDWREPVAETFPWVIASDVLYERRLHELLLGAIKALLGPGGVAWISDPQRTSAENFPLAAVEAGFKVGTVNIQGPSFTGVPQPGTLYVLTRAGK